MRVVIRQKAGEARQAVKRCGISGGEAQVCRRVDTHTVCCLGLSALLISRAERKKGNEENRREHNCRNINR